MSIEAINWAFEQDIKTSGKEKLILLVLANYADEDGICYPSISTICKKSSAARDTVFRSINYLIENGLIQKADKNNLPSKYKSNQNVYRLLVAVSNQSEYSTSPSMSDNPSEYEASSSPSTGHKPLIEPSINHHSVNTHAKTNDNLSVADTQTPMTQTKRKVFKKPSIEQIHDYAVNQLKYVNFDAGHFFDYYESKGWVVGSHGMKCWKSAVRNWNRQDKRNQPNNPKSNPPISQPPMPPEDEPLEDFQKRLNLCSPDFYDLLSKGLI